MHKTIKMFQTFKFIIPSFIIVLILKSSIGFVNSPKLISKDGHLIFEAGLDRNITFQLKGKSRLNINDEYDLLDLLIQIKKGRISSTSPTSPADNSEWSYEDEDTLKLLASNVTSLNTRFFGPNGLEFQFRVLQNRTRTANALLRRNKQRIQRVENRVQTLFDRLSADNCKSSPCQNGATCTNIFGSFACKCPKNFEGPVCDKDVNECAVYAGTDLGCQNGGQCVNQHGSFSCMCTSGWFGIHCTQRKGDCMQSSAWEMCGHGTCVNSNDTFGYKCICDQGWKTNGITPACTVDIDECNEGHASCVSKCINLPGSFTCAPCPAGLTGYGVTCQDINECQEDNGGCSVRPKVQCINSYGSYHCGECPLGYVGDGRTCTLDNSQSSTENSATIGGSGSSIVKCLTQNICHPQAKCFEISNTISCSCPPGMVGSGIGPNGCVVGTNVNCINRPCQNGGTCLDNGGNGYSCLCPPGFKPPNCTALPNPCSTNPCLNNGRCRPVTYGASINFTCQCMPGYTGSKCESRLNGCGRKLSGLTGRLTYPQGSLYDHNEQCAWVIATNESLVLNVTFQSFDVEDSTECRFDWLQLNDGRTAASQLIGRFCGSHKPLGGNIITTTNFLYLWFRSDNTTSKAGFDLEWNSIAPQCGGVVNVESHGTISSPGSPGKYPMNRDCHWRLIASVDKRIKLTFFSLNIETHDSCNYDYVEIIDEVSGNTLEKYCNSSHPQPLLLSTHEASIVFHSDNIASDFGFQIFYSTEERLPGCGGTYTAKNGRIQSPVITEESISCEYEFKMGASESVKIKFPTLKLGLEDCLEIYDLAPESNEKLLQVKHCGDDSIEVNKWISSQYNRLVVQFYGKQGSKFILQYASDCSYTFDSPKGTILSPSYPKLSNEDRLCTYQILTEPNTVISIWVADFDMKDSSLDDTDCFYTSMTMTGAKNNSNLGPYCGESAPPSDIVSESNIFEITFKTGITSQGRGFKLNYVSLPMGKMNCGGVYTKPGYTIRLPTDDEGLYMNDLECYWIIQAPKGKFIALNWKAFHLEANMDCTFDYLEISDNLANTEARPLARYCDSHPPVSTVTYSDSITLKFVSDTSDGASGFELSYDFVEINKQCGGELYASSGRIRTPNFPSNYSQNLDCTWIINTAEGSQVELQVEIFEVEQKPKCESDWLEIRNGGYNKSALIGRFCGNISAIPLTIPAFTNQIMLTFHSDAFVSSRGFQIRFTSYSNNCGGNLKADTSVITSPYYPNPYPNRLDCEWKIHVHHGSHIHFVIEDFDVEQNPGCSFDVLEIYSGSNDAKTNFKTVCALDNKNMQFTLENNEALISFRTDETNRHRGFMLSYQANCTTILTSFYGLIESPNYGGSLDEFEYMNDVNCTWTVKAPKGNNIQVEFLHFETLDKALYLEVKDANKTYRLTNGQSINSTTDTLVIKQQTNMLNFRLEYAMIGCMQVFRAAEGEIKSPNNPKTYPNNMECQWEIIAEPGQGIDVTVNNMDIEDSVNCTKDALLITSHLHDNNPKERHCGRMDTFDISSNSHHVYLKFSSDAQGNGKGFTVNYTTRKSKCGGLLTAKSGIITSPNYPNNYPESADCEWTITVQQHHSIVLQFEELDLEEYDECEMDYVEAFEYIEAGDVDVETEPLRLFKKCGNLAVYDKTWRSKTSSVTVRFHSDDSLPAKGFKLSYYEDCGQNVILEDDVYFYIQYESHASKNQTCEWELTSKDPAKKIALQFTHIQMNPDLASIYRTEGDCLDHGGVVYASINSSTPLARFCKTHPTDIISPGASLHVRVPVNVISELEAYAYQFDGRCGGVYRSLRGKFSTPYYPNSYPNNIACYWYVQASAGNHIALNFESMDVQNSDYCNQDYIEVREGKDSNDKLLGLYCGTSIPREVIGSTELQIIFKSDEDGVVGQGFFASYYYVMHNELNGTKGTIESPAYPAKFHSHDLYSWRITVDKDYVVLLTINHIIDTDIPHTKFYDGYSNIAAPIDYSTSHVIRSNTNILYFTAARGPFQFEWERLSKEVVRTNQTAERLTKLCGSQTINIEGSMLFRSPGYPRGYDSNLNCSWSFISANKGMHAVVQFLSIDLEEFEDCFADYIRISKSHDLVIWSKLDNLCKKSTETILKYAGNPYLKLDFVTDSAINKTGFSALVSTKCGSHLSDRRGFINITEMRLVPGHSYQMDCLWTITVRRGRRIRIKIPDSSLHAVGQTDCKTYFLVRNGIDEFSPFLGKGKYCDNNITDVLETSSNRAYVKFSRTGFINFQASFHYEEITQECSQQIQLVSGNAMDETQTVNSPNYPNLPNPHTECVWRIVSPLHTTITLSFIGKFDLAKADIDGEHCQQEYVQINDGYTENSAIIGKYCGTSTPNSIKSSSNILRLAYYTDISEPHMGFRANVSISRCGGSYHNPSGVIKSPSNLKLRQNEKDMECVYVIETELGTTINLTLIEVNLPEYSICLESSHIELQEIDTSSGLDNLTDTEFVCGTSLTYYIVETNKVIVRYKIKDGHYQANAFEMSYSTIGGGCHETIESPIGILQTPNYPLGAPYPIQCRWKLKVAKGKRIRLEVMDFDIGETSNRIYCSIQVSSSLYSSSFSNICKNNTMPALLYSSDNVMAIDILVLAYSHHRGIKLKYSSFESSVYCTQNLIYTEPNIVRSLHFGKLESDSSTADISCLYDLTPPENHTMAVHVVRFTKDIGSNMSLAIDCKRKSYIQLHVGDGNNLISNLLCGNRTSLPSFRVPFRTEMTLLANKVNKLQNLELQYTVYKCGGLLGFSYDDNFSIVHPNMTEGYRGKLECSWAVWSSDNPFAEDPPNFDDIQGDMHVDITLQTDLRGKCEDEYLIIYNGPNQNYPHLGRYCSQSSLANFVITGGLYMEYVVQEYNALSKFNLTLHEGSGCGGILKYPFRSITFNYQYLNNVECIWEVYTDPGFHLAAVFDDRFFIEDSTNCMNDYLKLQQNRAQSAKEITDDSWEDITTLCGRTRPNMINTTSSSMRLIFHSNNNITGDGFKVSFERNCGGIFYASSDGYQLLSSPNYPNVYPNNLLCNYTILPSPALNDSEANSLTVRIKDMVVEEGTFGKCIYDRVSIITQDVNGNSNEKVMCGKKANYEILSKTSIQVILHTDSYYGTKGFQFEYGHSKCGSVILNSTVIESPKDSSTNTFPHSSRCTWQLKAPENHKIQIKFQELEYENQMICLYDAVEIYKGLNAIESERLGKFCGNLTGSSLPILSIPQNTALIQSYSDDRDPSKGFRAIVEFLNNCDRKIHLGADNKTYIFHHFYGDQYANNLDCSWIFTTTPDSQLQIEFTKFHIENSTNCLDDYLQVRDGSGMYSDLVGQFCGHTMPSPLISSTSSLLMRFVTDSKESSTGFEATVNSVPRLCGQHNLDLKLSKDVTITSPKDGSGKYPNNVNCIWKLSANNNIHLIFEKLDLESSDKNGACSADYIKIINKEDAETIDNGYGSKFIFNGKASSSNFALISGFEFATEHIYCGNQLPDDYFSSSKTVFIKFRSNDKISQTGFKIKASQAHGCFRNFTGVQGRIQIQDSADHCDVYIKAPENTTLSLYYKELLFDSNCDDEYIQIFDAHTNSSLQKICGFTEAAKSLFTETNELRVHLRMGGYYSAFDVTYSASTNGPGCGGDFYNTAGVFTNPFYPNHIRNNSDCLWNVRVPSNLHVLLKFDVFNMGADSTCLTDYLQIIEHSVDSAGNAKEEVARQFCGSANPSNYKSKGSFVTVRFHKTVNYDGTGWVISFEGVRGDKTLLV